MAQTRKLLLAILLIAFSGGCWLAANAQQPSNEKAKSYVLIWLLFS